MLHDSQETAKVHEGWRRECLGESIYNVVGCGNLCDDDLSIFNTSPDPVVLDVEVFRSVMESLIHT